MYSCIKLKLFKILAIRFPEFENTRSLNGKEWHEPTMFISPVFVSSYLTHPLSHYLSKILLFIISVYFCNCYPSHMLKL
jgi:hypothetical protein